MSELGRVGKTPRCWLGDGGGALSEGVQGRPNSQGRDWSCPHLDLSPTTPPWTPEPQSCRRVNWGSLS